MHPRTAFIEAVKTARRARANRGDVITVVRKLFARRQARRLPNDTITFEDLLRTVLMFDHPFSAEQSHGAIGAVVNRDEVNKRMRPVLRQAFAAVMVDKFVETSSEPGENV